MATDPPPRRIRDELPALRILWDQGKWSISYVDTSLCIVFAPNQVLTWDETVMALETMFA